MPKSDSVDDVITDSQQRFRLFLRWVAVALGAWLVFAVTAARTIQWQDYGQFTLRILDGELFNELGLALAHPLHFWLGQLAVAVLPTEPAHAVALVSALGGAVTIANVFGCVATVTGRRDAALVAAFGLALANTFWRMSTMPECYTITTALLSAELWCVALYMRGKAANRDAWRWLAAAFFFNGLGLANHNLALLTGPILGWLWLHALISRRVCIWHGLLAATAWFIGAAPYLALVIIEAVSTGDVPAAIRSALFGNHYADQVMNANPSLKLIGISSAFTLLSFFNLTLPLALVGLWQVVRDRVRRGLWLAWSAALGIHLLFVLRYDVVDQHTFLLPTYTVIALFAGVGFAALAERWQPAATKKLLVTALVLVLAAPGIYLAAASVARSTDALGSFARNKPYRDDYRYLFVPWGVGETSAKRMAEHARELAGDGAIIVYGDSMARFAIRYTVQHRDPLDTDVYSVINEAAWRRPAEAGVRVVLVPASTADDPVAPPGMRWRKESPLYLLESDDSVPEPTP